MNKKLLSQFERDLQLRGLSELTQESYLNKVQSELGREIRKTLTGSEKNRSRYRFDR